LRVLFRSVALATLIIVALSSRTAAQNTNPGEIRGHVINAESTTPIATATVNVTVAGSAVSVARAPVGTDGNFHVQGLRPGRYRIQIRALGYKPWELASIDITAASPSVNVGTVTLIAAPLELQSMAVTEKRQEVQLAPDKNSYVVRDMPTTKGGNALDVLRNVPAVDVDIDNIVSLRGNSGVTVQINGRTSPMKPDQLGNFLSQLPADMVDKVEIVPNPSARDDPTGVAGIINIVLKQETDAGTSGGFTAAGATNGLATAGANYGYQHGALTFYGSVGLLRDRRPRSESLYRENNYLIPLTYLEESTARMQQRLVSTLTSSVGYELSKHDELSFDLLGSGRHDDESQAILYNNLNSARAVSFKSDRNSSGTNREFNLEATLGYKHAFAEKGHKLSSEFRVDQHTEGGPSSITSDTLSLDGAPLGFTDRENQTNSEHPSENSLKVDYVRPLGGGVRLETGYKGSLQRFHTTLDTQLFDSALSMYLPDSTRISDFTYNQDVNAAYGMLTAQRGKFQLQGGVRVEHASTQFHLNTLNATFDNAYNSVFPSGLVAYNINDAYQVKLSYSTRIRRPDDTDVLDPTPHFADPLNLSRGNPYLKPEYIRALELGVQRTADKVTIQLTPFFRRTIDAVRTLRSIDSAGVTTRTFANIATSDSYGGDANIAVSGRRLSGFAGASAFQQVSNAANLAPGLSINSFGWRARSNGALRVSKTLDVQALLSYQAPMTVEQGRNSSRTQFSMAVRQKLKEDQLSLTLRIIDPFNTSHESNTTIDPLFYQVSDRARAIRGLLLSVNWTFGKPDKEKDTIDLSGDGTP
jgi:Outer membrane protein beta-barrel family/Carboxypeptidase regulatory-like domain